MKTFWSILGFYTNNSRWSSERNSSFMFMFIFYQKILLNILNFCRDLSSFFLFENLRLFQSAGLLAWWWQFWNNPMKAIAEWVCSAGGLRNKMFIAHPHLKAYTYLVTILMIDITRICILRQDYQYTVAFAPTPLLCSVL